MSYKKIIIVLIIAVAIGGGFWAYKNYKDRPIVDQKLTSEKILSEFKNKNSQLTLDQLKGYEDRFNQVKADLQKNPEEQLADWLLVGVLKKAVGDFEGARDAWIYAGQISPKNSPSFANLADLYANFLKEPSKAESAIKQAIANDPKDPNYYVTLAEIYRYKIPGQETMYEQTLLDALNEIPDNVILVSQLASFYRQTKQVQKAIEFYEKLVALEPTNQTAKQDLEELKQIKN